jgi:hypothetical protein
MRVLLPKKSVTTNKKEERAKEKPKSGQSATKGQPVAERSTTDSLLPAGADVSRHVAKLEKEVKDLKKFLGVDSVQTESMGVCPKDGLSGEKVREDAFSSRKYVHLKDKAGHSWFDEVPVEG